jgi:hypothetical protein
MLRRFETQLGRFANPLHQFVEGSGLGMATGDLRDRSDVIAVLVALDDHVKLALQWIAGSM